MQSRGAIQWLRSGGYGDPETKGSGEQQCYDFFWFDQGLFDANYCAEAQSFFSEVTWAPGKSFSGCLGTSVVENLEVTISLLDIHPTAPPAEAQSCTGPEENDGLSPPLGSLPPDSVGSFAVHPVLVDVWGPEYGGEFVTGTGTFGSSSVMAHHFDASGDLVIDRWQMVGAEPASVGTSSIPMEVARFRLLLVGSRVARLDSGRWTLGQGDALFHLYGSAAGAGDAIDVVNTTPSEIQVLTPADPSCESQAGCLASDPFTIEHLDALGELWQLDVGEGRWAQ